MDKRPFFLLAGIFAATLVMADAYRWVDSNGVVHYTDKPTPGAERIDLPGANTTTVRRPSSSPTTAANTAAAAQQQQANSSQPAVRYESLAVASPAAEETLWNIEGTLNVSLSLNPALQPGHQVRVYFDGKPQMVQGTSFELQEVWRGVHNIQAEILDESGKMMIRSQPNRFYVQQNSVRF